MRLLLATTLFAAAWLTGCGPRTETTIGQDGQKTVKEFDKSGQVKSVRRYDASGRLREKLGYQPDDGVKYLDSYDEQARLRRTLFYRTNDLPWLLREFGENGSMTVQVSFDERGQTQEVTQFNTQDVTRSK